MWNFLRVCSVYVIWRIIFFSLGQKKLFSWSLWDHLLAIFVMFAVLVTLKLLKNLTSLRACSDLYAHAEHTGQDLLRALSMRIRNWCPPWPYASVSYAHAQHVHQFSNFSDVHFVYPQHARKELMCALNMRLRNWCIRLRNWCVHWAYMSGTNLCFERCIKFEKVPLKHAEHKRKELMRSLSVRFRNWCVH